MFTKKRLSITIATAVNFVNPSLVAQTLQQENVSIPEQTTEIKAGALEEVYVTGSRIKRGNIESASPINTIRADDIKLTGNINLGDFLNELPAFRSTFSNSNSGRFIGTVGLNLLDLRGLGTARTLVLQDGRRHISSAIGTSAVDINTIPEDLLLRVDTVTGGQSAVYGADAVTGVVNFITRDDFEGMKVNLHRMEPERSGGEATELSVTWGSNLFEGRGNFAVSAQRSETSQVFGRDRPWIVDAPGYQLNVENTGPNDGIPDELLVFNTTNNLLSENGVIWGEDQVSRALGFPADFISLLGLPGGPYSFTDDGQFITFDSGMFPPGDTTSIGGDGLNFASSTQLYPELESNNIFAKGHFDLSNGVRLFAEAKYSQTKAESFGQPTFDFFGDLEISSDNAYLPSQLSRLLKDNGLDSFSYNRFHSDLGLRGDLADRKIQRYVTGMNGEFTNNWSYEVSAVYGKYQGQVDFLNNRHNSRFFDAVDAVLDHASGEIVCRSTSARAKGCQPINLFGYQLNNEGVTNYFMLQNTSSYESMTQKTLSASTNGDLLHLPAGGVSTAFGLEYRKETSSVDYDQVIKDGETFLNALAASRGEYDVSEVYIEFSIPLLAGLPGIDDLTLDSSARLSDYSTVGNTTTWGASLYWIMAPDIRLRATTSESVRAPNISELFDPLGQNFFPVDDPCSRENLDNGQDPAQRTTNCRALGVPEGFNSVVDDSTVTGFSGGNPKLQEETAKSYTYGLVFNPQFAPDLTVTVDYWDIEITDAISAVSGQNLLDRCVDSANIDNVFCPLVPRDTSGELISITSTALNIARLTARGVDYQVNYDLDFSSLLGNTTNDWGTFKFSLIGTKLLERNDYPFEDDPNDPDEIAGELGDPIHNLTTNLTYRRGGMLLNWRSRYLDDMSLIDLGDRTDLQSPYRTGSVNYNDLQARYNFGKLEIYSGINNLENVAPPVGLSGVGGGSGIYTTLGRSFYLGVNYSL
ncbi:TonB-dependent receptor plug domain-containing protein [Microbulbifer sp. 2201CG32-9]|uniref:TonB-dependent receptor plug domain-containing protein n=1 Tax=Microbulbifer sp. 2201CG32-9 TaxID=3232309 RepID=UPI00345B8406